MNCFYSVGSIGSCSTTRKQNVLCSFLTEFGDPEIVAVAISQTTSHQGIKHRRGRRSRHTIGIRTDANASTLTFHPQNETISHQPTTIAIKLAWRALNKKMEIYLIYLYRLIDALFD